MSTSQLEQSAEPLSSPSTAPNAASSEAAAPREAAPKMEVVVVRRLSDLEPYRAAWEELAANSCEPNVFYEPWMLIPSLKAFASQRPMEFHLVFAAGCGPKSPKPVLYGFFPYERLRRLKGVPVRAVTLWKHLYCMLCTPLVRRGQEIDTLNALFDYYDRTSSAPEALVWNSVSADRAFGQILVEVLRRRRALTFVDELWNRALIRPNGRGGNEYVSNALSGKRRKELKRQQNRLTELGDVEFISLAPDKNDNGEYDSTDINAWIDQFLELEKRGWKGEDGGAFACNTVDQEYFRTIVTEGWQRRQLMMLSLQVDGRPIALKCDFLAGNGAFAFKIAYDEECFRYSPGVLLELEGIQRLHKSSRLRWMDSGAIPDHFMINRLWRERRTMQNLIIATTRGRGELVVTMLPVLRFVNRVARRAANRVGLKRPKASA